MTIPLVVTLPALMDAFKRWRGTLQPKRIIIGASITIVLWIIQGGFWVNCRRGFWGLDDDIDNRLNCPIMLYAGPYGSSQEYIRSVRHHIASLIPFFLAPVFVS